MRLFSRTLFDELSARAAASPRQRTHHNVHAEASDPVQRFFVAANRSSYFRPHRHLTKSELALVLRGQVEVVTFDDGGAITGRYSVGDGSPNLAYETPRGMWHTLIAQSDGSLFFEVKEGPYVPATASEFAPWAPPEGAAAATGFLEWARVAPIGASAPAL